MQMDGVDTDKAKNKKQQKTEELQTIYATVKEACVFCLWIKFLSL